MPDSHYITMKDIALRAKVSPSTVSLALRNDPRIKKATRLRIQEVAGEMGYRRDPTLSALIAHRTRIRPTGEYGTLAVFHDWDRPEADLPPSMLQTLQGIRKEADVQGFKIALFRIPEDDDDTGLRTLNRMLFHRGIRGVILAAIRRPSLCLEWKHFSGVVIGEYFDRPLIHRVGNSHETNLELVYRNLKALGYQRIGFCNSRISEERKHHRYLGAYYKCLHVEGKDVGSLSPWLYEDKHASPLDWLERVRPDAVICSLPHEFEKMLAGSRYRVPDELGLAGFSLPREGDPQTEPYAGSIVDYTHIGVTAVRLLQSLLHNSIRDIPSELERYDLRVGAVWREGESVHVQTTQNK
ncbi:LacI family DNA-binding transcriptional regulator [Kiritimatiellota bacterium B12222]|nr:LacI family DNA-binding transcriptional regulator [Kiritimatiellota bacterium B12222]